MSAALSLEDWCQICVAKGGAIRVSLCKCVCGHVYLMLKCRIRGQPMQSPDICKYESMKQVASRSR